MEWFQRADLADWGAQSGRRLFGVSQREADYAAAQEVQFHVASVDNYLGDPPAGFRRNSFQFTTGVTYSLK